MLHQRLKRYIRSIAKPGPLAQARDLRGGYLGDHRYLTTTAFGHKIFLDTRDMTLAPHVIVDGLWESWITDRVIASLQEGMRAIEVGSNLGWYTLLIAQHIGEQGKLIAFEANKQLAQLTLDSVCINGFFSRVELHNLAVSDSTGKVDFFIRERHLGNSSLGEVSQTHLDDFYDGQKRVTVSSVSLDQFLTGDDRKIDFMKIDAEGAEAKVFAGMENLLRENQDITIVMEYSPLQLKNLGTNPKEMMVFLYGLGFQSYRIEFSGELTEVKPDILSLAENYDMLLTRRRLLPK